MEVKVKVKVKVELVTGADVKNDQNIQMRRETGNRVMKRESD